MATQARQALGIPANAIDWPKLYETVNREYAQGRTEAEIPWEQIIADCTLDLEPWPRKLARGLAKVLQRPEWAFGLTMIVVLLGLLIFFAWNQQGARYEALDRQLKALSQQNASLQQENEALRKQVAEAVASYEQTRQRLTTQQATLEQRVAQLQQENETLKASFAQLSTQPIVLAVLQDAQGVVSVDSAGTVRLAGEATLPPSLSQTVSNLVTKGTVTPTQPVRVAMAQLRGDATRGALRSIRSAEEKKPVPISPVLTAVRSTTPTLQWEAVLGVQKYQVTIADPNDEIVWQGNAVTRAQVTVPSGVLQHGQIYFWQVEAFIDAESRLSPIVGFWVLNMETLREVEAAGRNYPNSALVLASVYQAHGLYEEGLAQLERLADMNPTSPLAQVMLDNLRRKLGRK